MHCWLYLGETALHFLKTLDKLNWWGYTGYIYLYDNTTDPIITSHRRHIKCGSCAKISHRIKSCPLKFEIV